MIFCQMNAQKNYFYNKKSIENDFYYKNTLQMIFCKEMHWK